MGTMPVPVPMATMLSYRCMSATGLPYGPMMLILRPSSPTSWSLEVHEPSSQTLVGGVRGMGATGRWQQCTWGTQGGGGASEGTRSDLCTRGQPQKLRRFRARVGVGGACRTHMSAVPKIDRTSRSLRQRLLPDERVVSAGGGGGEGAVDRLEYWGGGVRTGNFSLENISHRVYFAQWPENPVGNFAPFQDCNVYYWGGMFARRAPGACPARYLCIKYLISPGLASPREVPQVDRTRPQTFPAA